MRLNIPDYNYQKFFIIDTQKIIRIFIMAICFMCVFVVAGFNTRDAHQYMFMLLGMAAFGFLIDNIWVSLFLWWSIFLFTFFKFQIGQVYLTNIFFGCVFYYLIKSAFKKEHAQMFIDCVLWVAIINLLYSCLQVVRMDFIWEGKETLFGGRWGMPNFQAAPNGFMGNSSVAAYLYAFCIPLLFVKNSLTSKIGAFGLLIPIAVLMSSGVLVAAIIGLMFVLWFSILRKLWMFIFVALILGLCFVLLFMDTPGGERLQFWRMVTSDAKFHPITGWGMDSFRNFTQYKDKVYGLGLFHCNATGKTTTNLWDNPHNLYISLFFEFGLIGILIFVGYLANLWKKFIRSFQSPIIVGLAGFIVTFLAVSMGHFPIFLARIAVLVIPLFAIFEILTKKEKTDEGMA